MKEDDPIVLAMIEQLREQVFSPLEEVEKGITKDLLQRVRYELRTQPLIVFVSATCRYDDREPVLDATGQPEKDADGAPRQKITGWHEGVIEYRLGQPTPIDDSRVIFGMFFWEKTNLVVVYSVQLIAGESGKLGRRYFREIVRDWRTIDSQMSGPATVHQLRWMLEELPEPGAAKNGAGPKDDDDDDDDQPTAEN